MYPLTNLGVQAHTQILWNYFQPFHFIDCIQIQETEADHPETRQQECSECPSQQFGALPERKSTLMIWQRSGCPLKKALLDDHRLLAVVKKDPSTTPTQVNNSLQEVGVSLSNSTIMRENTGLSIQNLRFCFFVNYCLWSSCFCGLNVGHGIVHAASCVCGLFIIVPYTAKVCFHNYVLQLAHTNPGLPGRQSSRLPESHGAPCWGLRPLVHLDRWAKG